MTPPRISSYKEFRPYYLWERAKPGTRAIRLFGKVLAALSLVAGLTTSHPSLIILSLFAGYGPAWSGHFFIEKNRPATFTYPLWSAGLRLSHGVRLALGPPWRRTG